MKKSYKNWKEKALLLIMTFSSLSYLTLYSQTGTVDIEAEGPNSAVLKIKTTAATGYRVELMPDGGSYSEITAFADTAVHVDGFTYLLMKGLTESTKYYLKLIPFNETVDGTVDIDSLTTSTKGVLAYLKFESESNGRIKEETNGKTDSLLNAKIVESGSAKLGNSIEFKWTETIPGSGLWNYSAVYLDSALMHNYNRVINTSQKAMSPTELTYSFWFKNNDTLLSRTTGSTVFMAGDQFGSAIILYRDSLYVATGGKFGGTNLFYNKGVPFADDSWHHAAFVYKEGDVKFYLDGNETVSYNEDGKIFWNRLGVRMNDHWAKTMIGAAKWWNRPAHGIFGNYGDNVWHNQFNGLMDELKFFNYAFSPEEVASLRGEMLTKVTNPEVTARGPNSIVLGFKSSDTDTFRISVRTGADEFVSVLPEKKSLQNGMYYYLITGLVEDTGYDFEIAGISELGTGNPVAVSSTTRKKELFGYLKFDTQNNGRIKEETMGRTDSMMNASLVPGPTTVFGNAIRFQQTETIPGSGLYTNSAVYLDSAFWHIYDQVINSTEKATSPTEMSYSFWFKNNDLALAKDPGSMLFMTGDHFGSAIGLYNDSLWVATAAKFGPTNLMVKAGVPFSDEGWHHIAFVYKEGDINLFLDGNKIITLSEDGQWFWSRIGVRMNDHWAKSMIGAAKWWNRPANSIFPANYGDNLYHNQFNGLMDELKVFSYAISEEDIVSMYEELIVNTSKVDAAEISFFPNPASTTLFFTRPETGRLNIYDLTGKVVLNKELNMDNSLNISSLKKGLYLLKIDTKNQSYTARFIKE